MEMTSVLSESVGIAAACKLLGVPRSSWYRQQQASESSGRRPAPPRAMSDEERTAIRNVLNSERFRNETPRQIYATLLDEGTYYCHWRTMYRILAEAHEVQERRNQLTHPTYTKPELLATGENQLWSWDISKLKGKIRLTYYYLYVILDVYSRYVVGWMLADCESEALAQELITQTCARQGIAPGQLTLHADRGPSMTSKSVEQLLIDLEVAKSHSRPYTPNDNPFSEAHFKTLKYRPDYPGRFDSFDHAHQWVTTLFDWYNNHHYHSALNLMTPVTVHYGFEPQVRADRQQVLEQAYLDHPERFVQGTPALHPLPTAVWINPPHEQTTSQDSP
jgi:putative transposase